MKNILAIAFILTTFLFVSCENEDDDLGGGSSHNVGKNCLSCHSNFKLAGSVFDKSLSEGLAGVKIQITTQANGLGTVLATLSSDNSGNFYTRSTIDFGTGLFVSVEGASGIVNYMNSSITSGACNSCHGSTTSKLWAE